MSKSKQILRLHQVNSNNKTIIVTVSYIPSKAKQGRAAYSVRIKGRNPEYKYSEKEAVERARQIVEVFTAGGTDFESGTLRATVDLYLKKIEKKYRDGIIVWDYYVGLAQRAQDLIDIKSKIVKEELLDLPRNHWRCKRDGRYVKDANGEFIHQYTPRIVNHVEVGRLKVADIVQDDCVNLLKEFTTQPNGKPYAQHTKDAYLLSLIYVLDVAKGLNWCLENPARKLENDRPKHNRTEKEIEDAPLEPFPPEQIEKMLASAKKAEKTHGNILWCDSLALTFLCRTGLRFGELAALKWKFVDFKNKRVIVRTAMRRDEHGVIIGAPKDTGRKKKNHKDRVIPLWPSLVAELQEWKLRSPCSDDEDRVFITPSLNMITSAWNLRVNVLRGACNKIGFKPYPDKELRLHDLRHVFASMAFDYHGENYTEVARLMGHSKIDTTRDIYTHWFDDAERDMKDAEGMEGAWRRKSKQFG